MSEMTQSNSTFNDAGIRPALRDKILFNQENNAVVIEELGICRGQVRVDMALVNGTLHGYEIKSDRDSLSRLLGQIELYGKVLDHATLVVGEKHIVDAFNMVPEWWSILRMYPDESTPWFYTLRTGFKNPNRDARSLVELLWLEEAIELLETRNATKGVKSKPRRFVWDRVCEHFNVDEIGAVVRAKLKIRAGKLVGSRLS